jgi:hypothetical protein
MQGNIASNFAAKHLNEARETNPFEKLHDIWVWIPDREWEISPRDRRRDYLPWGKGLDGTYWGSFAIACEGRDRGSDSAIRAGNATAAAIRSHDLGLILGKVVQ